MSNPYFTPSEGTEIVRIYPLVNMDGAWFQPGFVYYNLFEQPTLSPRTFGETDPVADYAERLPWKTLEQELERDHTLSERFYSAVVVGDPAEPGFDPERSVNIWTYGVQVWAQLIELESSAFWHPVDGSLLTLYTRTVSRGDRSFRETRVVLGRVSPVAPNPDTLASLFHNQRDVRSEFAGRREEDVERVLTYATTKLAPYARARALHHQRTVSRRSGMQSARLRAYARATT